MNTLDFVLEILFKDIAPHKILNAAFTDPATATAPHGADEMAHYGNFGEKALVKALRAENDFYGLEEIQHMAGVMAVYSHSATDRDADLFRSEKRLNVFSLLYKYADKCLRVMNDEPVCRFENLLRWRKLSHKLDEDTLTTCFLANFDTVHAIDRYHFFWPPVVRTDNIRLKNILQKKIAENHFHLKGSAPHFNLSWINIMNKITKNEWDDGAVLAIRRHINALDESRLSPLLSYEPAQVLGLADLCQIAAYIRLALYHFGNAQDALCDPALRVLRSIHAHPYDLRHNAELLALGNDVNGDMDYITVHAGLQVRGQYVDYALRYADIQKARDGIKNNNLALYGERCLLYRAYKRLLTLEHRSADASDDAAKRASAALANRFGNLLYLYLLIKIRFRGELVQVNNKVGFANFANYQERKDIFIEDNRLLCDALVYMAVKDSLHNQHIQHLEARITPADTEIAYAKKVADTDSVLDWAYFAEDFYSRYVREQRATDKPPAWKQYFYVVHFPKEADKTPYVLDAPLAQRLPLENVYRHQAYRERLRKQAESIGALRNHNREQAARIMGIDACNYELVCRPEVYAVAYRYLFGHRSKQNDMLKGAFYLPQLHSTYHVGEDFSDLIDGLRAIQEAVFFLNLRQGSRLGHGLALGVDAVSWYESKHFRLLVTLQDLLDNLAWLYAQIRRYQIKDRYHFALQIEKQFTYYFNELYRKFIPPGKYDNFHIDIGVYYDAWKLRGDDPSLYRWVEADKSRSYRCEKPPYRTEWDNYRLNYVDFPTTAYGNSIRNNSAAVFLYHHYHYNVDIKAMGAVPVEFPVNIEYAQVADEIQKRMQTWINDLYIGVETNPSSNVLIGTFKRYDRHPILRWYNTGLTADTDALRRCPQMFVSINTDDQGVFNTCLENEYALMALALEKATDKNGDKIYKQNQIYDWLDNIRKMGLEQRFNAEADHAVKTDEAIFFTQP